MSQANAQTPAPPKPAPPKRQPPPKPPVEFQGDAIMKLSAPELLKILQNPSSTRYQKSKACMQLAVVGDKSAVPVLAGMLGDPEMAHYARFGLVPITDPSVDEALRAAAGKLTGLLRVNVIDAIGSRRDAGAINLLVPMITGSDKAAALAAITALGLISGPAAASALEDALGKTQDALRREVASACLVCAEGFLLKGQQKPALDLLARLSEPDIPKAIRMGAMNRVIELETRPGWPK